ncbi:unnamed protein product [Cuscuta europaea]|uniref:J domain-containing protein n=1 Tax=Cuscuta europaea TaxID=41803 RepID=A0A9P0YT75_CUSEU|nr:unnamed protein product [Cuscuta europaea]
MDELDVLARDYGIRPAGKSAPMRSDAGDLRSSSARPSLSSPFFDDRDGPVFNDAFGGPPRYKNSNANSKDSGMNDFDYGSVLKAGNHSKSNISSLPVYDKPVYDDDIFEGMPGIKSKSLSSSTARIEDMFASVAPQPKKSHNTDHLDDLLGNVGKNEKMTDIKSSTSSRGFDDLLAGFGSVNPAVTNRPSTESNQASKRSGNSNRTSSVADYPFTFLETSSAAPSTRVFSVPLKSTINPGKSGKSVWGGGFDELVDPLNSLGGSVPSFSHDRNTKSNKSPSRNRSVRNEKQVPHSRDNDKESFSRHSGIHPHYAANEDGSPESLVDRPIRDSLKPLRRDAASTPRSPQYASVGQNETSSWVDISPVLEEQEHISGDIWITVSEVPLFTHPTNAPPPSRPPPPIPRHTSKSEAGPFASHPLKSDVYSSSPRYMQYSQSPKTFGAVAKSSTGSQLHELEEFANGASTQNSADGTASALSGEQMNANSIAAASAAAMKEAMDRAEAKFRRAKEVREREYAKAGRSSVHLEKDEYDMHEVQDRESKEKDEVLERERCQRVKEEEEQSRLGRERERARQAVERATREARERAAAAARIKAERAAVEKAAGEARERAGRAAVQRVQAEARERAAVEAREKAASAKTELFEARRREERAAVERAATEARERAAVAAATSRVNQEKNGDDLESFFSMGSRASSAPRPRETMLDAQFQNKGGPEGAKATSSPGLASNLRKASSTANLVDDLSSIFGAAPSSGEFQEFEGESEERRRARLERHQRTQERTAKALAEKNQRDLQVQRDQEERHRIAETLDIEIKRWAAGKEGNLRALLSTMQYVLWPECGWQPVSLTDLITGASVKKAYRKATLCIHPDKVQQKGATLQQKYIAEKVFDLLKEAWNKFNSEELF